MDYILIHNPGCSSSKKGLELLQQNGVEPIIRRYMLVAERLSEDELREISRKMGAASPRAFLRQKDAIRAGLPENADDNTLFAAMASNPGLIQRPIGIHAEKAALGRPNSALLDIV